jgi:hypothetical protein
MTSIYAGRSAVLTTMHRKEDAIRPPFETLLGLRIEVSEGIDTDRLGTFSGEIEREGNMLDVAIRKARLGMARTGSVLGLASEGSFGPHPSLPFIAAGIELLVFVDEERAITIHEILVSEDTNFAHRPVRAGECIDDFLLQTGFPDHALIVRPEPVEDKLPLANGIRSRELLEAALSAATELSPMRMARIETDMRANFNPTRLAVIGTLARKLAQRVVTCCPACSTPGWAPVDGKAGLPCELCGNPTGLIAAAIYGCSKCELRLALPREDGLESASSYYCSRCNP